MIGPKDSTVFWSWVTYDDWKFIIAATEKGLCFVGSTNMSYEDMAKWVYRRDPDSLLIRNDEKCKSYINELIEYLKGERQNFTVPMDVRGTSFQLEVWDALHSIPYGQTRSYSDISEQIGKPMSARAVGTAIGANPLLIIVPCHRVIAKNGSLNGYRGGLDMKAKLLQVEKSAPIFFSHNTSKSGIMN
ncbi:methylated-DNA--[protein]-cysteine S-methyltransferase [Bacillus sp. FJAT-49711]|uniref:methylated-DNA--[protein]-cysteine S-methyltransferase n=1 Tax=Bacillus sp. FJAT-49711 TaxID=2833585 RepID=UPI001BC90B77|nr:methylated-DNA--[protein]-cysteine S-methyltransferase [Bacillus sp. FJAT-49711]MBS4218290.1 methylated-DNA--[protein]-cysteine S-methyltransferase [Bacillus sp. FJAT-49711]